MLHVYRYAASVSVNEESNKPKSSEVIIQVSHHFCILVSSIITLIYSTMEYVICKGVFIKEVESFLVSVCMLPKNVVISENTIKKK